MSCIVGQEPKPKRPNILFCISDDQSWIHTSVAGDPVVKTPHFDRIAKEGLLFTNSFTACPSCSPSRAAILTGQDFWRLEEGGLLFGRLRKDFPIYTKLLTDAGYAVGQVGKGYGPAHQEFDFTWQSPCGESWDVEQELEEQEEEEGIEMIDYAAGFSQFMEAKKKDQPFCFWYGGYEPHRDFVYGSGQKAGLDPKKVNVPPFLPDSEEIRNDISDYLYEIEHFDKHLGKMLQTLETHGELDNTIIIVTSDNGMPFPRAKATAYNYGTHMPLAIRWGKGIKNPGRIIEDFVNHIDFAPTFLEMAGLKAPHNMTGKSLLPIFNSTSEGLVDKNRTMTVTGLERHVWARPEGKPYPTRAIYTKDFVYIRNYEPDRWPMGNPDFVASHQGLYGDIDAGPTKSYMLKHQNNKKVNTLFEMSFGKRPLEELYKRDDPEQLNNLANDPKYQSIKKNLSQRLISYQKQTNDPRVEGKSLWDDYPFYADKKYLKGTYLDEYNSQ